MPAWALAGVLGLGLGLGAAPGARAAADDLNASSSPIAAPATPSPAPAGVVAVARKLINDALESERAVVAVLRENVASHVMASSWRLSVQAPYVTRATGLVMRAPLPAAAGTRPATGSADRSLGARWRVVRGDADTHVPAVAWMPDLLNADAHAAALRPTMHLSGEWALPNDFTLGVMPGMAIDLTPQGRRLATGTLAVTLGKTWSPQWRTFVDMARDRLATVQIGGTSTTLDAGLTFVASASTQVDVAITHGLSDMAPPFEAGVGISSSF